MAIHKAIPRPPREPDPDPREAYLLHHTELNSQVRDRPVVWVQSVLDNPQGYRDLQYDYHLVQHESQDAKEFANLVEAMLDVANGKAQPMEFAIIRRLKARYSPFMDRNAGCQFFIAENVCKGIAERGEDPLLALRLLRYPHQPAEDLREILKAIDKARAIRREQNPEPLTRTYGVDTGTYTREESPYFK